MNKKNLILIGGGGHAKACIDVIQSSDQYQIIGYLDIKQTIESKYNIPYLGDDSNIEKYLNDSSFIITIGQIKSASVRTKIFNLLTSLGADIATVISKYAIVSNYASIGKGTIVMHSAIIQANATVGENCIINDCALVEHDVQIGDHCHISTSAILNGEVIVGNSTFIGSGTVVKNGIQIGESVVVGLGSIIRENINNNQIWAGNPAKQILG